MPVDLRALAVVLALLASPLAAQEQRLPPPTRPFPFEATPSPEAKPAPRPNRRRAAPAPLPAEEAKAKLPPLPADPAKRLDVLFERLRDAPDAATARRLERDIRTQLEQSGSATTDVMLARASKALAGQQADLALDLTDYAILLNPRFAGAYHARALAHMLRKDEEAALRDLKTTLALEPRHFPAIAMLVQMFRAGGNRKAAFQALSRLREIDPQFPDLDKALEDMRKDAEGQKI